ncbi:MAG: alpha/beta hydrolase [Nocardioides sp.]
MLTEDVGGFPCYTLTRRGTTPRRTLLYVHGGAYMAPIDPLHVRYVTRLATRLGARVVLPDYPLAPEHTWRDSYAALLGLAARVLGEPASLLAGDSAGGGYALALAQGLRDQALPQAERMLLHSPWVDLTMSAPGTAAAAVWDPWLHPGKAHAYAGWWAGTPEDLARTEVSPGLGELAGLPGADAVRHRDLLAPGCQELARRAVEADWSLVADEEPGLLHVYALMPFLPESRSAF